jgi:hypothetical protein
MKKNMVRYAFVVIMLENERQDRIGPQKSEEKAAKESSN